MTLALPFVAVGSLGGTISMTPSATAGGVVPTLDAAQLTASIPGLNAVAEIGAASILRLPSASLSTSDVLQSLAWAEEQVRDGAMGVVLTQGTDTIEETAFLLDLYWSHAQPLIVTGAMRTPLSAGADGPANLLAAVQVAVSPDSRGRGVLVVMNDTIHAARFVAKGDALSVQAFVSPDFGPLGRVIEGSPTYLGAPLHRTVLAKPSTPLPRIALVTALLGDDGELASAAIHAGYEGVVVAGFGAGHVSAAFARRIESLTQQVPVVVASRTGGGCTATATYGFEGSEIDLAKRGALLAGWLSPLKARLVLAALLGANTPASDLAARLAEWGKLRGNAEH